jgi:hypothetical protein
LILSQFQINPDIFFEFTAKPRLVYQGHGSKVLIPLRNQHPIQGSSGHGDRGFALGAWPEKKVVIPHHKGKLENRSPACFKSH